MTDDRKRRVAALEVTATPSSGGVLRQLEGETEAQALERAALEGRRGGFLLLPQAPVDREAWGREVAARQAELLRRSAAWVDQCSKTGDFTPELPD